MLSSGADQVSLSAMIVNAKIIATGAQPSKRLRLICELSAEKSCDPAVIKLLVRCDSQLTILKCLWPSFPQTQQKVPASFFTQPENSKLLRLGFFYAKLADIHILIITITNAPAKPRFNRNRSRRMKIINADWIELEITFCVASERINIY